MIDIDTLSNYVCFHLSAKSSSAIVDGNFTISAEKFMPTVKEALENYFKNKVVTVLCLEDVEEAAFNRSLELTKAAAFEIIHDLQNEQDEVSGVSWDTIASYLEMRDRYWIWHHDDLVTYILEVSKERGWDMYWDDAEELIEDYTEETSNFLTKEIHKEEIERWVKSSTIAEINDEKI